MLEFHLPWFQTSSHGPGMHDIAGVPCSDFPPENAFVKLRPDICLQHQSPTLDSHDRGAHEQVSLSRRTCEGDDAGRQRVQGAGQLRGGDRARWDGDRAALAGPWVAVRRRRRRCRRTCGADHGRQVRQRGRPAPHLAM